MGRHLQHCVGELKCLQCGLLIKGRKRKFCSHDCHTQSQMNRQFGDEHKAKISLANAGRKLTLEHKQKISAALKKRDKKYNRDEISSIRSYRIACLFKFDFEKYQNEFDTELINQYGWYAPKNSKNCNLSGVSKDHLISIKFGFDNQIDPKIMSHPANCQIMIHTNNVKKGKFCSLTIEELLSKIAYLDKKY